MLGWCQLARVVRDWEVVLFDHRAKLKVGGIGIDVERLVDVGKMEKNVFSDQRLDGIEGGLLVGAPVEFAFTSEIGEWL